MHICKNLQEFYGKYAFFVLFLWLFCKNCIILQPES